MITFKIRMEGIWSLYDEMMAHCLKYINVYRGRSLLSDCSACIDSRVKRARIIGEACKIKDSAEPCVRLLMILRITIKRSRRL